MADTQRSGGIGILGALAIVFITLKLGGWGQPADWSWWWVLSPLWIPWAIVGAVLLTIGIVYAAASLGMLLFARRRRPASAPRPRKRKMDGFSL